MAIISTLPNVASYLSQIRNILRIGLTSEDLPDATIQEAAFLRRAELAVYEKTGLTDQTYDAISDPLKQERLRIAVLYRTAALLVPALPEIVRESFLGELQQFAQIDWEQKIAFFNSQADDAIEQDTPVQTSSIGSVGSSYTRFTFEQC